MDDLIAFVTARLDEDEATARACDYAEWRVGGEVDVMGADPGAENAYVAVGPWGGPMDEEDAVHIARHDPARVLRDVEAKRAVLREYAADGSGAETPDYWFGLSVAVMAIAGAWSDHPDFLARWKS